jgi:MinD superfamily P-loop ATPase
MKQLLILSGKGGTGKTTIAGAFAVMSREAVFADCDVDAADLRLLLEPDKSKTEAYSFSGGVKAVIDPSLCKSCGECARLCRFGAIKRGSTAYEVKTIECEGCGVCEWNCPSNAITLNSAETGEVYLSETPYGTLAHARLLPGAENSGKLVTEVRKRALAAAKAENAKIIIIDGPPGIGCPVIASMTGVDAALIVTEPSLSGMHDLKRAAELISGFGADTYIAVNKYDINPKITDKIIEGAKNVGIALAGLVPYDKTVRDAQRKGQSITEYDIPAAEAVRAIVNKLNEELLKE